MSKIYADYKKTTNTLYLLVGITNQNWHIFVKIYFIQMQPEIKIKNNSNIANTQA